MADYFPVGNLIVNRPVILYVPYVLYTPPSGICIKPLRPVPVAHKASLCILSGNETSNHLYGQLVLDKPFPKI